MSDETPEERAALERLDEATREVGWDELDKERERESFWRPGVSGSGRGGPLAGGLLWRWRFPSLRRRHDPDPGDERGLRDALHDADRRGKSS